MLILGQLLFSLPVSNGKVERVFSQLNLIKSNKRASLGNDTLIDLVTLNADKVELHDFSPDAAINLWWEAKTRKPDQCPRKQYKKRTPHHQALEAPSDDNIEEECGEGEENDEEDTNEAQTKFSLDDWDEWLQNND